MRKLPRSFQGSLPRGARHPTVYCGGVLVIQGPEYSTDTALPGILAQHPDLQEWPLIVLVDNAKQATRSDPRFIWTAFTRFEPAADLHAQSRVHRHHLVYSGPIVLDARMKPGYPDELFCDPDTAKTVDQRWKEYFPEGGVEMGDSDVANLD